MSSRLLLMLLRMWRDSSFSLWIWFVFSWERFVWSKCNKIGSDLWDAEKWGVVYFFLAGCDTICLGGLQRKQMTSTVNLGFFHCDVWSNSSTILGVTQMTCWPFQYLTMLRDWRVEMMSVWEIEVMLDKSLIERTPRKSRRISNRTHDQYDRYESLPEKNWVKLKKILI